MFFRWTSRMAERVRSKAMLAVWAMALTLTAPAFAGGLQLIAGHAETSAALPSTVGVPRLEAVASPMTLMQGNASESMNTVLPQLHVVDLTTGLPAQTGQLPPPLAAFVRRHRLPSIGGKPIAPKTLAEIMPTLWHPDGRRYTQLELGEHKHFALFQYWASWCAPCLQEGKDLGELLRQHPMPDVVWMAVESDPTKPYRRDGGPVVSAIQEH
jgi:thiol-disulfide isomerase/thioredoxin